MAFGFASPFQSHLGSLAYRAMQPPQQAQPPALPAAPDLSKLGITMPQAQPTPLPPAQQPTQTPAPQTSTADTAASAAPAAAASDAPPAASGALGASAWSQILSSLLGAL